MNVTELFSQELRNLALRPKPVGPPVPPASSQRVQAGSQRVKVARSFHTTVIPAVSTQSRFGKNGPLPPTDHTQVISPVATIKVSGTLICLVSLDLQRQL